MTIVIDGEPTGKGRPRLSSRNGFVRVHTPNKTVAYEDKVKLAYRTQVSRKEPYNDNTPLSVTIVCFFSIPKSWSKKKREASIGQWSNRKPDVDNVAKIILDALNGLAYEDDKQIVSLHIYKWWAEEPKVMVTIEGEEI